MLQHTIKTSIKIKGIGLHSGNTVEIKIIPADINTGIIFRRNDFEPNIDIKVSPYNIEEAIMCTLLIHPSKKNISISTIEHLMSAFSAFKIDNAIIELNSGELPVMDGSAIEFVSAIQKSGLQKQNCNRRIIQVLKTVVVNHEDKFAMVSPSDTLKYEFEIQWQDNVISKTPSHIMYEDNLNAYIKDISRARTFGFVSQIDYLHTNNLAKGASLENAIGVTENDIANKGGLRYPDEFVKHKLLDAIGDFYLGGAILGHFKCFKSGHTLNNRLLKKLFDDGSAYKIID